MEIKKRLCCSLIAVLLVCWGTSAQAGEGKFAVGLSYVDGFSDVIDHLKQPFEEAGYEMDTFYIPAGLTFVGGYKFDSGLDILADVGPFAYYYIDAWLGPLSGEYSYWDLPVGLTVGYDFSSGSKVSPFIRGGVRYHFAGGDFDTDSSIGPYVAGGINFFNTSAVKLQLEIAYDASKISIRNVDGVEKDIETGGFMFSIRAAF